MSKSKELLGKLGKLLEQSIINYKDFSGEILNMFNSKRDEFIFKMRITGKEETEILNKRLEKLEKKIAGLEKKKTKKAKKP